MWGERAAGLTESRLRTVTHGYARVRTVTHGYARVYTVTHGYARLRTVTHGYARVRTVPNGYARGSQRRPERRKRGSTLKIWRGAMKKMPQSIAHTYEGSVASRSCEIEKLIWENLVCE